jgi:hypothetical protein
MRIELLPSDDGESPDRYWLVRTVRQGGRTQAKANLSKRYGFASGHDGMMGDEDGRRSTFGAYSRAVASGADTDAARWAVASVAELERRDFLDDMRAQGLL